MTFWSTLGAALQTVSSARADVFERLRALLGSSDDKEARQAAFSMAVVALAAKMAKADGVVTMSEAQSFWSRFDVPEAGQRAIRRLFELAQQDVAGFEAYAQKIARLFPEDDAVREDILDMLFAIATADGVIHEDELAFLERVAEIFAIDPVRFDRLKARHVQPDYDPHAVLGLPPNASLSEVRRRYRELVAEHHPDRMVARGVPPEFVRLATDRLAAINGAYEEIARRAS